MITKEQWLKDFNNPCYKQNKYEFHPYGNMVVKHNKKEVVCFYPLTQEDGSVNSFVVNTFQIECLDEDTWYRECAEYNWAENCTQHRLYDADNAYEIYSNFLAENLHNTK